MSKVFIETGTFLGDQIAHELISGSWDELHTIELDYDLYEAANARFANIDSVHVHHGSSPDVIPLIADPDSPTTFYLDAHKTGTGDKQGAALTGRDFTRWDCERGECPLIAELHAITSIPWTVKPTIIIDDAQNFYPGAQFWRTKSAKYYDPLQWPGIFEIVGALDGYTVDEQPQARKATMTLVAKATS